MTSASTEDFKGSYHFVKSNKSSKESSDWIERWAGKEFVPGDASPFGTTEDGAMDYRGADLRDVTLCDFNATDSDFSGARFDRARMINCSFSNCSFVRAILSASSIRSCHFHECDLRAAALRMARIGYHGTDFQRCNFDGVNLRDVSFFNAVFTGIAFQSGDWSHIDFSASGFWDCSFNGKLVGVTFRGNYLFPYQEELSGKPQRSGLHNVDFQNASLHWVTFGDNCALDSISLPLDGQAIMSRISLLHKVGEILEHGSEEHVAYRRYFRIIGPSLAAQTATIVSRNDLVEVGGEKTGSALYEVIKRMANDN